MSFSYVIYNLERKRVKTPAIEFDIGRQKERIQKLILTDERMSEK